MAEQTRRLAAYDDRCEAATFPYKLPVFFWHTFFMWGEAVVVKFEMNLTTNAQVDGTAREPESALGRIGEVFPHPLNGTGQGADEDDFTCVSEASVVVVGHG